MNFYLFVFIALILTIILEFVVYSIFIRNDYGKLLLYSVLINAFTNPLANLAYSLKSSFLFIEFLVILIEIPLIKYLFKIKYWKAILISIIANIVSIILGFLIFIYFPFY